MNKAGFVQKGETIDVTNSGSAAIGYGEIVSLNTRVGVAAAPIAVGEAGAVHVVGVFEFPKAAEAVTLGAAMYYDATNDVMTTVATGNVSAGWSVAAAASADADVKVKLG